MAPDPMSLTPEAGASLVADMLTKSLQKGRLALLRPMLGLESLM